MKMNSNKKVFVVFIFVFFLLATIFGKAALADDTYKFKMPHVFSSTSSQHQGALYFADLVKKKTNGKVEITVYGDGVMGGDREICEGVQRGAIELAFINIGGVTGFNKKLNLANMPYVFSSYKQVDKLIYDGGWVGQELNKYMMELGIRCLSFIENDFRAMTNNKRPIKSVKDIKGLKFRVPSSESFVTLFKAFGAIVTPMAFPELYTGLQQRTVDGQENGIILTESSRLYEVQKYLTRTNHMYTEAGLSISEKLWQSLSPELQKSLQEAANETSKYQRELTRASVATALEKMKKSGVQVLELTPEELKEFVTVGRSVWNRFENLLAPGVLDKLRKET